MQYIRLLRFDETHFSLSCPFFFFENKAFFFYAELDRLVLENVRYHLITDRLQAS